VSDLVVDGKLLSVVRDDEDTDGARAAAESGLELGPEVTLVNDAESLLDLARLGHGDELTIVTDVDEAVLLEDRSEEGVEDNRRGGVRDNAGLLVKLLGEQVNTEVTMLAGLGRGGDADDLARAVLEDHQVADADVVAGDGEGALRGRVNGRDVRRRGVLVAVVMAGGVLVGARVLVVVVLSHFVFLEVLLEVFVGLLLLDDDLARDDGLLLVDGLSGERKVVDRINYLRAFLDVFDGLAGVDRGGLLVLLGFELVLEVGGVVVLLRLVKAEVVLGVLVLVLLVVILLLVEMELGVVVVAVVVLVELVVKLVVDLLL